MPDIGRFSSIDRFSAKYTFQSGYSYGAGNPIKYIDVNGDSIKYANEDIRNYVSKFASPTIVNKKGKEKSNPNYNEGFAKLVSNLENSSETFLFTDDASKMLKKDPNQLGEFNISPDGSMLNIIVPNSGSPLLELFGGRGAVLAEEVYHANQYLNGDITKTKSSSGFGLKPNVGFSTMLIEYEAKLFAANSGMAELRSNNHIPGYSIQTFSGLIKSAKSKEEAVRILMFGTTKTVFPSLGSGPPTTITYGASYSIY